jgi:peroxiredoxin Q/BCP
MTAPAIGKKIVNFGLDSTAGAWHLKDAIGTKLVIYFYPRDNTPGCTQESEAFRDLHAQFKKTKTIVIGISPDSVLSHQKFKSKFSLPFDLLADPERTICNLFDVIKEKSLYGKKYMGVERSTFLIDEKGVLRQEWRKVKVTGHAEAVLTAARAL